MLFASHIQDYDANDYLLHSEFAARLRDGKNSELAAYFTPAGLMRVSDLASGALIEEGRGREGVSSLARSIRENVEFRDFTTSRLRWVAGGMDFVWSATLRNWGTGPARAASGNVRIEFGEGGIHCADVMFDNDVWFALVRPGAQWRQAGALAI